MDITSELLRKRASRRSFLAGAGATGAAALVAGCSSSPAALPVTPAVPAVTDADILTFALNLEYLEAEFYLRAVTGSGLTSADNASSEAAAGTVTGGSKVTFTDASVAAYAAEISLNELTHVRFLRSALTAAGITPVSAPAIDFTNAFTAAALAAGVITTGETFNPFADQTSFLLGAFVFEDVGVTAYTGSAALLKSKTYLSAAAGIQAVEAYHAAEIRTFISNLGGTALAAANQISALRSTLGGGGETTLSSGIDASGLVANVSAATISAADASGLAFGRSTDQVLHIVYATANGAGVSSGGFFPSGLNGTIKTTAS